MKRHQIHVLSSTTGKTFAACQTCHLKSKQGTKQNAEAWQGRHINETSTPERAL